MKLDKGLFVSVFGEFCATAMLLTMHCAGTDSKSIAGGGVLQWGLNYGIAVLISMHIFENVSGAHINPCVTIAAIIMGKIKWDVAILYIVVQFVGAIVGFAIAYFMTPAHSNQSDFCVTRLCISSELWQGCLLEFALTCCWVLARCIAWDSRGEAFHDSCSLRVGLTVSGLAIAGGYFTGASMNPARTLAPAIFSGIYDDIWVYFVAPILAGILMPITWIFFFQSLSGGGGGGGD